jgi:hypothetical protein
MVSQRIRRKFKVFVSLVHGRITVIFTGGWGRLPSRSAWHFLGNRFKSEKPQIRITWTIIFF